MFIPVVQRQLEGDKCKYLLVTFISVIAFWNYNVRFLHRTDTYTVRGFFTFCR